MPAISNGQHRLLTPRLPSNLLTGLPKGSGGQRTREEKERVRKRGKEGERERKIEGKLHSGVQIVFALGVLLALGEDTQIVH